MNTTIDKAAIKAIIEEIEADEWALHLTEERARYARDTAFSKALAEKQNKRRSTLHVQKTISRRAFEFGRAISKFRNAKSIRASHAENEAFEVQ